PPYAPVEELTFNEDDGGSSGLRQDFPLPSNPTTPPSCQTAKWLNCQITTNEPRASYFYVVD
ncbi:hypothetical protein E4U46_001076, partial [Claviceps purpurea]